MTVITRRKDTITAERPSTALLTRAAFGIDAGLRSALFYGIPTPLAEDVLHRPPTSVRIQVPGAGKRADRMLHVRAS